VRLLKDDVTKVRQNYYFLSEKSGMSRIVRKSAILVLSLLMITGIIGGLASANVVDLSGSDISVQLENSFTDSRDEAVMVESEELTIWIGPEDRRADEYYTYCLEIQEPVDCEAGVLSEGYFYPFRFSASEFEVGEYQLSASMFEYESSYSLIEKVDFKLTVIADDGDQDGDGLTNLREIGSDTSYIEADSDGDGLNDGFEVRRYGSDPTREDTDQDGLTDGEEVNRYNTDPIEEDTDNDGLVDGQEVDRYRTVPDNPHSDGDGLEDGLEVNQYGTDPTKTDTDGDGLDDGTEIDRDTDPKDPDSPEDDGIFGLGDGAENVGESRGDEFTRGFFVNNPESTSLLGGLDGSQITALGLLLSIVGILLELLRGG
jgi:hypothetical protein